MQELNVLEQIGYSYARLKEPITFEEWKDQDDYSSYSYIVNEILSTNYNSEWWLENYPQESKWANENGLNHIEGDSGGEGCGEYCYMIFSWQGKTYKIEYSYYSYNGNNFDDVEDTIREVKPVEKLVIVYEDM